MTSVATPPLQKSYPHARTFFLLGAHIEIRARHKEFLDDVEAQFAASVVQRPWISPDIVVYSEWARANPAFFRSRPETPGQPLPGIYVQDAGQEPQAWDSFNAPMPPMSAKSLRNRFVALHSAAVVTPSGQCVLLPGMRGSGKSTISLLLVREYRCALLSDENALIHRRSCLVDPLPRALHIWSSCNGRLQKHPVPVTSVDGIRMAAPALATHAILLERQPDAPITLAALDPVAAFQAFLPHSLDFGCAWNECVVTLLHLVTTIQTWKLTYGEYAQVSAVARQIMNLVDGPSGRESLGAGKI